MHRIGEAWGLSCIWRCHEAVQPLCDRGMVSGGERRLVDEYRNERRIEIAFEEQRFFDARG